MGFFALKKDLADHVGELFPALAPLVERQQMQIQALSPEARARFNAKNYVEQNRMTGLAITGLVLSSVCIAIIAVGFLI